MDLSEIRNKIRGARQSKRMTQLDLSRNAGLGMTTVVRFERGYGKASLETVIRMCEALGIKLEVKRE
jgi:DNA-binding XRE family transcriptional regulator